jgi:hypothetical protein
MKKSGYTSAADKYELYMRQQSPIYRQLCEEKEAREQSMTKNKSNKIKRGKRR